MSQGSCSTDRASNWLRKPPPGTGATDSTWARQGWESLTIATRRGTVGWDPTVARAGSAQVAVLSAP